MISEECVGWSRDRQVRQEVLGVLSNYRYKPFRNLGLGSDEMLASAFLASLAEGRLVVARGASGINGLAFYHDLPWDSKLFGIRMGRISAIVADGHDVASSLVDAIVRQCKDEGMRHLSTRADVSDLQTIQALERAGFYLVDMLLTLYRTDKSSIDAKEFQNYSPQYREDVLEIARRSFTTSRFSADPYLDQRAVRQLHSKWAEDSLDGRADFIRVAMSGARPIGFVFCRRTVEDMAGKPLVVGILDLIAVTPEHQGRGVGKGLIRAACQWLARNSDVYFVGTRGDNFAAIGAYTSLGFRFYSGKVGLHSWQGD